MKKIELYKNGKYLCTTTRYKTLKSAINSIASKQEICVASIPDKIVQIKPDDKITACFV